MVWAESDRELAASDGALEPAEQAVDWETWDQGSDLGGQQPE